MYTKIIAYLLSKLSLGLGVALLIPTAMSIIKDEACTFAFVSSQTQQHHAGFSGYDPALPPGKHALIHSRIRVNFMKLSETLLPEMFFCPEKSSSLIRQQAITALPRSMR